MSEERPLVTFALFAYNQERFVREAVEGAFAQDYSPLEIILSDDCSTDRTFEIMQEVVAGYRGRHRVLINRNQQNLGIAGHINHVMQLVRTDFVVVAAGDDISLPHRTRALVSAWLASGRLAKLIHSQATDIDQCGKELGTIRQGSSDEVLNCLAAHADRIVNVLGATGGLDMEVIRRFPPIHKQVRNEDVVLSFRAALIGSVIGVPAPLVKYRTEVGTSFEVVRRRKQGVYQPSGAVLLDPYVCFVQKHRDLKTLHPNSELESTLRARRAEWLLPLALRRRHALTARQVRFFAKRCRWAPALKELLKARFPILVKAKQRAQFRTLKSASAESW